MKICKVIGNVWATKKDVKLEGAKLMLVRPLDEKKGEMMIAADYVGAGIGERVLVVTGSTARYASGKEGAPIDASIVGIVDSIEIAENERADYPEGSK
ncbi:MAG: EutN/CcmL family microcompartment protein [Emergencia sp.]|nr:EutN/CcmL family microcompartment protein [Emergencia sp.]